MEKFWKSQPQAPPIVTVSPTTSDATSGNTESSASVLSDYDQYRRTLLTTTECDGWEAELWCYLKDMPTDVSPETDIVEWWQVSLIILLLNGYFLNSHLESLQHLSYSWKNCAGHPPHPCILSPLWMALFGSKGSCRWLAISPWLKEIWTVANHEVRMAQ